MDFLFDIYQQGKITEAKQKAEKAANKADRFADEIKSLEHRLDRLALATQKLSKLIAAAAGRNSWGLPEFSR